MINHRILAFIFIGHFITNSAMDNKPIHAQLFIDEMRNQSAVYGSEELHNTLEVLNIHTNITDLLIPIRINPPIDQMPSYLPLKEIEISSTGTILPFILNHKELILTCSSKEKTGLSFESQVQTCLTAFNQEPKFATTGNNSAEYGKLRNQLIQQGLIQQKPIIQIAHCCVTKPMHNPRGFKPTTKKHHLHQHINMRQLIGSKQNLKK